MPWPMTVFRQILATLQAMLTVLQAINRQLILNGLKQDATNARLDTLIALETPARATKLRIKLGAPSKRG